MGFPFSPVLSVYTLDLCKSFKPKLVWQSIGQLLTTSHSSYKIENATSTTKQIQIRIMRRKRNRTLFHQEIIMVGHDWYDTITPRDKTNNPWRSSTSWFYYNMTYTRNQHTILCCLAWPCPYCTCPLEILRCLDPIYIKFDVTWTWPIIDPHRWYRSCWVATKESGMKHFVTTRQIMDATLMSMVR